MSNASSEKRYARLMQVASKKMAQLQSDLDQVKQKQTEPIAIVGMACRFPQADNVAEFWELLRDGVDAIGYIPADRWRADDYYTPDTDDPMRMYTRHFGAINGVDQFDPQFFGISPREANNMDPQQRLLLEVTWETLESAGIAPDTLRGSSTGIYVGLTTHDYTLLDEWAMSYPKDYHSDLGTWHCVAAGRLAYILGTQGPTVHLDTACSASLVAIHLACQSLRNGEANLALAGGANVILSPESMIALCRIQALSSRGRCHTFDASADGYVRGEGCGMVVLKRLSDAVSAGDNILAVIRGSAVNHDGPSSRLTAPNEQAQEVLLKQALRNAQVTPQDIQYVEAHGTGTPLGDPIEIEALSAVFAARSEPLWVGSVKTNIGHLEAAAGIAGLIKVILALQHHQIPPHLNFHQPSPYIDWDNSPVRIPTERRAWPAEKRIAGVSSFGFSGTNAHVILEEAPAELAGSSTSDDVATQTASERPQQLLNLSAKSDLALRDLAQRYSDYLGTTSASSLGDVCYVANTGRSHFSHRLSVTAETAGQMQAKLAAYAQGQAQPGLSQGVTPEYQPAPRVGYLFTGQGSQYAGMGRELYESQPTFRQTLDACAEILRSHLEQPLLSVLYPETETEAALVHQTAYTQPALFALEYALAALWRSWGVEPEVVLGHSVGEYVAACVAGVFSLEEGLGLITARGRLMQALPGEGSMVAVGASEDQVAEMLAGYEGSVSLAAINGSERVVISGEREGVAEIVARLAEMGVKSRTLQVSHAFHSPLMEPMLAEFERVAGAVSYREPEIGLVSNVSGKLVQREVTEPGYWVGHVMQPVRFAAGVKCLVESGVEVVLELGPQPTLLSLGRAELGDELGVSWLPSLRRKQSDWAVMLGSLGGLYCRGVALDWAGYEAGYRRRKVVLPAYPFQHQRYWAEANNQRVSDPPAKPAEQTPLFDLFQQGDITQLADYLGKTESLSAEQEEILALLVKRHRQETAAATLPDRLYEIAWQAAKAPAQAELPTGGWLILADAGGAGHRLAEMLRQHGVACLEVYAAADYHAQVDHTIRLNPRRPDHLERLLTELSMNETPVWHIVHCWSLDATPTADLTSEALAAAQTLACGTLLHLVQALSRQQSGFEARLWVVTQGVVSIAGAEDTSADGLAVAQAPVWGLGKVIDLEYPDLWGGLIDLPPQAEFDYRSLLDAIAQPAGENLIALRQSQRYVARLIPSPPAPTQPQAVRAIRAEGTYLITGGLGLWA